MRKMLILAAALALVSCGGGSTVAPAFVAADIDGTWDATLTDPYTSVALPFIVELNNVDGVITGNAYIATAPTNSGSVFGSIDKENKGSLNIRLQSVNILTKTAKFTSSSFYTSSQVSGWQYGTGNLKLVKRV